MIDRIRQHVEAHPEWRRRPHAPLSFLKLSTVASGRAGQPGKVLLLVFEAGETSPSFCVKTVRSYQDAELVRRQYKNLERLTSSNPHTVFATPLTLEDDGAIIYSIETAGPGEHFGPTSTARQAVIEAYTAWQRELIEATTRRLDASGLEAYFEALLHDLDLSREAATNWRNRYHELALDPSLRLPTLLQHGDLTLDNILRDGTQLRFIDYDYVGCSELAGFDLFHFILKTKPRGVTLEAELGRWYPPFLERLGAGTPSPRLYFLYFLDEYRRKGYAGKEGDGREVLERFTRLMAE